MKKIIAIIGSPNNEKSNTVTMTRDFLDMVKQYNKNVEYEIISLGDMRVEPCHGCWACMKVGQCVYKNDDLQKITQKILESDLLVIGSPVYVNQISAQTKTLIDRTFMWVHLSRLIGKPVVTALTTGNDGLRMTEVYLSAVTTMMGGIVIGHLRGIGQQPGVFPGRSESMEKNRKIAKKTARILSGESKLKPTIFNSLCFFMMRQHNKRSFKRRKQNDSDYKAFEHQYWIDKGWNHLSYKKALERERATQL